MRHLITTILLLGSISVSAQYTADTFSVFFSLNSDKISAAQQYKIDSLIYMNAIVHGKEIVVAGYADYLGEDTANQPLSERRAKAVYDYLLSSGYNTEEVRDYAGYGEVAGGNNIADGEPQNRRADIIYGDSVWLQKPAQPIAKKKSKLTLDVDNLKKNETLVLKNIYFVPGTPTIMESSNSELNKLFLTMRDNPNLKIKIEGHICCMPDNQTDSYDYVNNDSRLSHNRARAVYETLIGRGINPERLSYEGFGATRKLVKVEKTKEDMQKNRRVEIRIIDK